MELGNGEVTENLEFQERANQPSETIPTVESSTSGTEDAEVRQTQSGNDLSLSSEGECCVLRHSNFTGRLHFEGHVRIECHVGAQIFGTGTITVAAGATVIGPIQAPYVVVAGRVVADIIASKRIEVGPSGMLFGNLNAPAVIIHENAKVEGRFIMTQNRHPEPS
jgi:cytoskeletal protein CcmA (bactofilin family)